jgi:hypothetical protein
VEITKIECDVVESTVSNAILDQIRDLNDLQLAVIGGGVGEISPY